MHLKSIFRNIGLAGALLIAASPALSVDDFLKRKEEGWFWYQKEPELIIPEKIEVPEPKEEALPEVVKIEVPKKEKTEPLSVQWFKKSYEDLLHNAVDNPTPENVEKYRYATRVMLDKASNFGREFKKQALLDPFLDESNRYPFSSAMRGSFMRMTNKAKTNALKTISEKAGIWIFVNSTCDFCALQYPVIKNSIRENGWVAKFITPDGERPSYMDAEDDLAKDDGHSDHFKIKIWPSVALVVPPEKVIVLTQGMLSRDLFEERVLMAGDMAGLLGGEDRLAIFPNERGILTPEDIREAGKFIDEDGDAFKTKVQDLIEKRSF
jgi:conjugal transfer pilus assembly protein TraF